MLSKFSALWLVVLILLPFTAPFPTCDVADLFGRSAADHRMAPVPPTSSTTLIADAESSLLVPPQASRARQLRQAALSDLNTRHFAAGSPLITLVSRVGVDAGTGSERPPLAVLRL
jgi:hypothetical protein